VKRLLALLLLAALHGAVPTLAQDAKIFDGADIGLGEELIATHQCAACHQKKVGGDGSAIYRPKGRISTAGMLRGMVEQCNTEPCPTRYEPEGGVYFQRGMSLKGESEVRWEWVDHRKDGDQHGRIKAVND